MGGSQVVGGVPETNAGSETSDMRLSVETGRPEIDLRKVIEGMPAWVQVCSLDGTIQMVNHAATQISGYERPEMEGQAWPYPWFTNSGLSGHGEVWSLGPWPQAELERTGQIPEFEGTCATAQGTAVILGVTLSLLRDEQHRPQHVLMVAWDHTQRKAREIELSQAQKIQAVRQLASGIAHDINNNLAVILGYSEFLLGSSDSFGDMVRQALSAIQEQSVDCANTVKRIQLFARTVPKSHFSRFSLNDAVQDVIKSTQPVWKYRTQKEGIGIRVETELADLPPVYGYWDGLEEALAGLVSNSVDALSQGGVISIRTRDGGDEAVLEVTDNGVGIAPVHINRIFDAFYTTKGPASSGLGLSIAYNLIVQQGGTISVSSQEGQGTTFIIRLPYEKGDTGDTCGRDQAKGNKALKILVVDDEPLVADVFRTFLQSLGHQAVTCLSGPVALEMMAQQGVDLALVDLGMPDMDGWELSRQINQRCPDFPIVVATGWNVSVEDGKEQGARIRAVLQKPFGMHELARAVEDALR